MSSVITPILFRCNCVRCAQLLSWPPKSLTRALHEKRPSLTTFILKFGGWKASNSMLWHCLIRGTATRLSFFLDVLAIKFAFSTFSTFGIKRFSFQMNGGLYCSIWPTNLAKLSFNICSVTWSAREPIVWKTNGIGAQQTETHLFGHFRSWPIVLSLSSKFCPNYPFLEICNNSMKMSSNLRLTHNNETCVTCGQKRVKAVSFVDQKPRPTQRTPVDNGSMYRGFMSTVRDGEFQGLLSACIWLSGQ